MADRIKSSERKKLPGKSPAMPLDQGQMPAQSVTSRASDTPAGSDFPIVGIGASAGGLAAFEAFFSGLPADSKSGMAFILVQHLAPDHKSILTELVQRCTKMQVFEIEDGMVVKPDCAYIIPPNQDLALLNGVLHLLEQPEQRGLRLPIDHFFRSLAQDRRERAVCVILSGMGSDGTLGARAVKGEGGMVMAQSPDSSESGSMPDSVIAAGLADFVLPPAEMPAAIAQYVARVFPSGARPISARAASSPRAIPDSVIKKICVVLRAQTGHDFSQYKENTLSRRIERRMAVQSVDHPDDYLRFLRETPAEADALFRDLLINVTSFFRDAPVFATLEREAIPRLFAGKPAGATIRIWVCGCSTGEEAYSMAILILEHLEKLKQTFKVQIFATDMDRQAVDLARTGVYPASIEADVSPERLERFFAKKPAGNAYRIRNTVRDLLIFSEQDLIRDPPFSRLDLISCRNLLIYLNADLQKRIIPLFHYALRPEGLLFLGNSENVGEFPTLFSALDQKAKIFLRKPNVPGAIRPRLGDYSPSPPPSPPAAAPLPLLPLAKVQDPDQTDLRELTKRLLLLLQREGPLEKAAAIDSAVDVDARIAALEEELRAKDEHLQTTIEEMETSQEELTSTNEEMQSVNEELQSANEELETSREEMQSVNEELATVNAELQTKVADLSRANNDMNNLMTGTGVGTVFVDHQLRISRFTPAVTQIISLIAADVGRPIGQIAANLKGYDRLVKDVKQVLDTLIPVEAEVETREGAWHLMRIQPYRTLENVIEGAVITFIDITERKKMEKELREAALRVESLRVMQKSFFENIVTTVREPFVVLDAALRVVSANRAFYKKFRIEPEQTVGIPLFELGKRKWDIPEIRRLFEEILPRDSSFEDVEVTHKFEALGQRTMLLNARSLAGEADEARYILLSIEDVTGSDEQAGRVATT